jgi:hypothetical protein
MFPYSAQGAVGMTEPIPTSGILKCVFYHVTSRHDATASINPSREATRWDIPNQCSKFDISLFVITDSGLSGNNDLSDEVIDQLI